VNRPRKAYFDHRALGIRFKYEDESYKPLTLPDIDSMQVEALANRARHLEVLAHHKLEFSVASAPRKAVIPIAPQALERLHPAARTIRAAAATSGAQRMIARLLNVQLGLVQGTGFDVHLTDQPKGELRRDDPTFVGSIALFRHAHAKGEADAHGHSSAGSDESFDVTKALAAVKGEKLEGLSLVLIPYSLLTVPGQSTTIFNGRESLKANGVEFLRMELN
jgi:hypothetical protein